VSRASSSGTLPTMRKRRGLVQLFTEARAAPRFGKQPRRRRFVWRRPSCFSALAWMMQRRREELSRGYFPREVFFFGLGFLVLPVLSGAASLFGRLGDTGSLLPWLAVPSRLRSPAPSRPAGRSTRRYRSASPACQSTEPSRPRPETAIVNGCRKHARPAKVARRCVPPSLSRATAVSRLSQQTTCQQTGAAAADQATRS
jgi:hypothetical protein